MAVHVLADLIQKTITGDFIRGEEKIFSNVQCRLWYREEDRDAFEPAEWGGSFNLKKLAGFVNPIGETLRFHTASGETVQMVIVSSEFERGAGQNVTLFSAELAGVGLQPKELYDPPLAPKFEPPKVKVAMVRYNCDMPEESFDNLRDALNYVRWAIDDNVAAPKWITVPSTLIGHATAKFDSNQIYAMLSLLED